MTSKLELKIRISRLEAEVVVLRRLVRKVTDAAGSDATDTVDTLTRLESDVSDLVQRLREVPTS